MLGAFVALVTLATTIGFEPPPASSRGGHRRGRRRVGRHR
jgi:hypothetical protein